MTKDKAIWKARVLHDKCVKAEIKEQLQVMVAALIDINTLIIEYGEFDSYPSCVHWQKKFCREKRKKAVGKYKSYRWYGNNETEIYCEIIKSFCGATPLYFPFTVLGNTTKDGEQE